MFFWDWNPKRNRRLLIQSQLALANCQNGWGNTHLQVVELTDKCKDLEAEIARLERLNNA